MDKETKLKMYDEISRIVRNVEIACDDSDDPTINKANEKCRKNAYNEIKKIVWGE